MISLSLHSFYRVNEVQRFEYSRPIRKGEKNPDNEFAVKKQKWPPSPNLMPPFTKLPVKKKERILRDPTVQGLMPVCVMHRDPDIRPLQIQCNDDHYTDAVTKVPVMLLESDWHFESLPVLRAHSPPCRIYLSLPLGCESWSRCWCLCYKEVHGGTVC